MISCHVLIGFENKSSKVPSLRSSEILFIVSAGIRKKSVQ